MLPNKEGETDLVMNVVTEVAVSFEVRDGDPIWRGTSAVVGIGIAETVIPTTMSTSAMEIGFVIVLKGGRIAIDAKEQ